MKFVVLRAIVFASVVVASPVMAADFTSYIMGNSLSVDLMNHFRSYANTYQVNHGNTYHWGGQYRPSTTLTYLHDNPTDAGQSGAGIATQSGVNLTSGQWYPPTTNNSSYWSNVLPVTRLDAVMFEPYRSTTGAAAPYVCTLGADNSVINDMITKTRNAPGGINTSTRFFLYGAWPDWQAEVAPYTNAKYQAKFTAATTNNDAQAGLLSRGYYQNLYNRVHTDNPTASVSVIPVGEVFFTLSQKMAAGQFSPASNLTNIGQVYRDLYHLNSLGQDIASWTAYATLFKESPVGLNGIDLVNGIGTGFSEYYTSALPAADKLLIQQTIWQIVSQDLVNYTNVPEPASGIMILGGFALLGARRR